MESRIHPLPLYLNAPDTIFNHAFFANAANTLGELLSVHMHLAPFIKVIDVPAVTGGRYLELVMDSEQEEGLAYLDGKGGTR